MDYLLWIENRDIVLASNGEGGYFVAEIIGNYYYEQGKDCLIVDLSDGLMSLFQGDLCLKSSRIRQVLLAHVAIFRSILRLENLIAEGTHLTPSIHQDKIETYKERSLHRLLSNYLLSKNIFSKTIFHESSNKTDQAKKWVHPDMVGVKYNEFQEIVTRSLLKATETKEYVELYSFELKRSITNDHQLKEYLSSSL